MWRRWNYNNERGGPVIGQPTLFDTTVEEGYLETIPEVDSIKSKRSSANTTAALPELPFRPMSQVQRLQQQHREPYWSQPSPTIPDYYGSYGQDPQTDTYPDISPSSTPRRSNSERSGEETPVSPIEPPLPIRARSPLANEYRSRIPQRVPSESIGQADTSSSQKQETKWDAYSGEPTKDESGLPSTVKPGSVLPLEHQYPQLKERTKQILAGIREREAAANRPVWPQQPAPNQFSEPLDRVVHKAPWKGASGRTTLVDPVQDNPSARKYPIKRSQHTVGPVQQPDVIVETAESPAPTLRTVASDESIKPIAPLKIMTKSRTTSPQSSTQSLSPFTAEAMHSAPPMYQNPKTLQSPFSSPGPVRMTEVPTPLSSVRADSPPMDTAPETPRTPTPPGFYENETPVKIQDTPHDPEVSRFSWTTYATSVTESPGNTARILREESPPPPVPPVPQLHIRKRPVPGVHSENLYANKDVRPSEGSAIIRKPIGSKPRTSSATDSKRLSLSKTLPQVPPELEAIDKISNLEAQLDGLSMRRHNTTRIIRDLNLSLKKNAIAYDMWKRREIAERIASHEEDLQTINNEEHEIALRLHRALKKRDREDSYELPTGLWIKRITT